MATRLWISSVAALALFVVLGFAVTVMPLSPVDVAVAAALFGHGVRAAIVFTESGRTLPIALIGLIGIGALAALRMPPWIGIGVLASQIISQGVVELIKHIFQRVRPDQWLVYHEAGYSYPSGHACTAVVFFGSWCLIVLAAPFVVLTVRAAELELTRPLYYVLRYAVRFLGYVGARRCPSRTRDRPAAVAAAGLDGIAFFCTRSRTAPTQRRTWLP